MGLLARTLVALTCGAAACYAPELRDCILSCETANDCAGGQVCSSDHFCVAAASGSCAVAGDAGGSVTLADATDQSAPTDASRPAPDASPAPDAAVVGAISIGIEGKGYVTVVGIGTCDSDAPQKGNCVFDVPLVLAVTIHATPSNDWSFDRWTTSTCPDETSSTCTFSPLVATQVGVKFRRDN